MCAVPSATEGRNTGRIQGRLETRQGSESVSSADPQVSLESHSVPCAPGQEVTQGLQNLWAWDGEMKPPQPATSASAKLMTQIIVTEGMTF